MNECLTIQEYRGQHPIGGSMTNLSLNVWSMAPRKGLV